MSSKAKSCYIHSEDKSLLAVYLPDSEAVFIGRSPETNITDSKCSRQQVRLCANYAEHVVTVQQVGARPCGLNGFKTVKDVKVVAKHRDRLQVLYGKYAYQIEFNPPPVDALKETSKKRSHKDEEELESVETALNSHKVRKMDKVIDDKNKDRTGVDSKAAQNSSESLNSTTATSIEESSSSKILTPGWEHIINGQLYIYNAEALQHRSKVASYDMDGTLITTRSGSVFPKDYNDWQILYPEIPGKLKKLHADGYKIVIFTNQSGLSAGKTKIGDFKKKIERVVQKLGVPIQVFIAAGKSIYRKPATGMWQMLVTEKNGGITVEKSNSFYVGDAAGRQKNWAPGKKKDHSSVDRLLALNLGIKFQTPGEHFLGHKPAPYLLPVFNPKILPRNGNLCDPADAKLAHDEQEMILMVGCPGSGKSHFAKYYFKGYGYINRDSLGSWQKCVASIEQFLAGGKSVIVDNTNPNPTVRQRYIEVAKKFNVPSRCFVMGTSNEQIKHNNRFRELTDASHAKVGDIVINTFLKNFAAPTLNEGYKEIVQVNFLPRFTKHEDRILYEMYLLES